MKWMAIVPNEWLSAYLNILICVVFLSLEATFHKPRIFNEMIVECDNDATVFVLHSTFTSLFCLLHECQSLKSSVLLVLALNDMIIVLHQAFVRVTLARNTWFAASCLSKQPQVLLQMGKLRLRVHTFVHAPNVVTNPLNRRVVTRIKDRIIQD